MNQRVKFINKDKSEFFSTLKKRVDDYFATNNISRNANKLMISKTIVMLLMYFVPLVLVFTGVATGFSFWLCWIISGLGIAGIGMSVMHDANHGSYSSNTTLNNLMGHLVDLIGGDAGNWKIQHNVLHHAYTNIQGLDEDIDNKSILRFSPHGKHKPVHKFQIFYALFFYSIMTIYWATAKDYIQLFRYKKLGLIKEAGTSFTGKLVRITVVKIIYFTSILWLPIYVLGFSWQGIVGGFIVMHLVAGLVLSIVFQVAHVIEEAQFPLPDSLGNIENDWAIHQLQTTADFSAGNKLLTFYVGGLNYQVIHHLFPRICHVHYPALAPIVEKTAQEFGLKYLYFPTFGEAIRSHLRLINRLGKREIRQLAVEM
ncbi:MAG: acyl-CoA desaturase [Bacteroidetes bacterium]|nr:acyl-CoA desaturase [Bacteroidota bacterium]